MKIEDMREKSFCRFNKLEIGDAFQPVDFSCVYLKTETTHREGDAVNAICLDNGYMVYMNATIEVERLDAKVVIE